jgi:hypothetical protein
LNLRASVRFSDWIEVNGYVQNLLGARAMVGSAGQSQGRTCAFTSIDCATYTQFNPFVEQTYQTPRMFGMQVNVRKVAKGWIQSGKSGEGFVMDIQGPGRVWTQTRNAGALVDWLTTVLPFTRA